ncbi:MAG: ComEC/Rec2 family competence protein, partial [Bdellovibrionales bacterium]|nr:ComEC/Rec2 family competence protein [Bdellovibrionales bacterium]
TAYTVVTGAQLATVRALCMVICGGLCRVVGRSPQRARLITSSAIVVLLVWPGAFFEVGFQLSFAAVVGLFAAGELNERWKRSSITWKLLVQPMVYSLGAWLATMPFVAQWFGAVVPLAPMINAVFVFPLCVTALVSGFAGVLTVSLLPGVGYGILSIGAGMVALLLRLLEWIDVLTSGTSLGGWQVTHTRLLWGVWLGSIFSALILAWQVGWRQAHARCAAPGDGGRSQQ